MPFSSSSEIPPVLAQARTAASDKTVVLTSADVTNDGDAVVAAASEAIASSIAAVKSTTGWRISRRRKWNDPNEEGPATSKARTDVPEFSCSICHEAFALIKARCAPVVFLAKCSHVFCKACIDECIATTTERRLKCPKCRKSLTKPIYSILHL